MQTAEQDSEGASPPGAAAGSAPPPTIRTRLTFLWFALAAVVLTVPFSIVQALTHRFRPTAHNFKRWAGKWGGAILGSVGLHVHVEQRVRLDPDRPYVFVSNHQNLLDILALAAGLPYPFGFVAKQELRRVPFLGFALRHSASVFIDRSDPRRSIESLKEAGLRIRGGHSVLVFPEGTRSYRAALGPLKKGAFAVAVEAGVPLVPVTVVDAYRYMNERARAVRPRGTIHIVIGEPIPMEGRRRRDIPELVEAVRGQMEAALADEAGALS